MKAINYTNKNLITYKVTKQYSILFLFMLLFICSFVCKDKVAYAVTFVFFLYKGGNILKLELIEQAKKYVEDFFKNVLVDMIIITH